MAKNKKDLDLADSSNLNQIKKSTNVVFNILFVILALTCIIPVVFIFIISITSEQSIKMNGYQFIPESYSLDAYKFLFREGEMILRALGVSVLVTAVGTTLGVILTMLMGYVLSRSNYKLNGFFTMVVFIPMIFNGGMISSYVVNTQLLNLKNSIWSLILPLCVSSFNVVNVRHSLRQIFRNQLLNRHRLMVQHSFRFLERLHFRCQSRLWQLSHCS